MSGVLFNKINGIRASQETWEGREVVRLTAMGHRFKIGETAFVVCECNCGTILSVRSRELTSHHTTSCGCRKKDVATARLTTHNSRWTPEYAVWCDMKSRCTNPNNKRYSDWGGRGIKVCDRWLNSFENFYADMGPKPTPKHSIERNDNDKDYSPDNCHWATRTEQANNKRNNVMLTFCGILKTAQEWSIVSGVPAALIRKRLRKGWHPTVAAWLPGKTRKNGKYGW